MLRSIAWVVAMLVVGGCGAAGGAAQSKPVSVIALVGGRVQPSPDATAVPDGVVLIADGRIASVGRRADVNVPSGATIVDCAGATVMAGFWNSHVHFTPSAFRQAATAPAQGLGDELRDEAQMSELPSRLLLKNIQWPSRENEGTASFAGVLTIPPRFSGGPQAASTDARRDTQMSLPPNPSGRLELK